MDIAAALDRARRDAAIKPRTGIVRVVPAASRITVEVDTVQLVLPYLADTYAVGDTVLVLGNYVLGKLGSPAVVPPPPDPVDAAPEPTSSLHRVTILPKSTGTYRAGKWRDTTDLYQGDYGGYGLNRGAAYYGNQLVALGADLTKPRSIVVKYRRQRGGVFAAQAPTFWTITERSRPAGTPGLASSSAGTAVAVDSVASWELPAGWVDELLNGTRGGLGIYTASSTPYIVLDGRADYAAAFALTVSYYA